MGSVSRSSGFTACALDGTSLPASEQCIAGTLERNVVCVFKLKRHQRFGANTCKISLQSTTSVNPNPHVKMMRLALQLGSRQARMASSLSRPAVLSPLVVHAQRSYRGMNRIEDMSAPPANPTVAGCHAPQLTHSPPSAQCLHRRRGKRRVGSRAARSRT
mgnify:CR=1 FL=1